jgi:hypothetical protein
MADSRIIGAMDPRLVRQLEASGFFEALESDDDVIVEPLRVERRRPAIGDIGDLIAELIGDDDYDDVGDYEEMGRRRRRKRLSRLASREGMVAMPKPVAQRLASAAADASAARKDEAEAQNIMAIESGRPRTAGGRILAASDQVELYLPFSAASTVAAAAGSTGTLTANVQRKMQIHRIVLSAFDSVAFGDAIDTLGITGISIGVEPIFNAQGIAPAAAFSSRAVGVRLLTPAATVGQLVTIGLSRPSAVTNPSVVLGYAIGVSARE